MTRFDPPPRAERVAAYGEIVTIVLLSFLAATALLALPVTAGLLGPGDTARTALTLAAIVAGTALVLRAIHWLPVTIFYALLAAGSYVVIVLSLIVGRISPTVTPRILSSYLYVAMDSSPQEATEFFRMYVTTADVLTAVLVLLAIVASAVVFRRESPISHRTRLSVAGVLLLAGSGMGSLTRDGFDRIATPFVAARRQHRVDMTAIARYTANTRAATVAVTRPPGLGDRSETYVLVIGESTTRHNMQIYGYGRPTTPRLSAIRDSLFVFQDAMAPHAHTIPVLKKLLTFADSEQPMAWRTGPDLMTIFRSAGFRTSWLSNQGVFGTYDTWTTAFARRAHETLFTNVGSSPYDDVLFEPYERALQNRAQKKFIVVQLMGTHMRAAKRYPPSAAIFGSQSPLPASYRHVSKPEDKRLIDAYDNAVAFNDYVVHVLLERFRQSGNTRAAFIYVADHGEEVKHINDYLGHSEFRRSPFMLEIPLVIWCTPNLATATPPRRDELERRPHTTDQLIHTILDLADVTLDGYRADRSLFAPVYSAPTSRPSTRTELTSGADPRDFPTRVWVHRTNSAEKLGALISRFQGFELDLVYDSSSDVFDVRHPPVPSAGLSLEELFASHAAVPQRYFWLDVKNLDDRNADAALKTLRRIASRFGLEKNLIVESPRPDLLTRFTDAGFYTSYYLPATSEFDSPSDWLVEVSSQLSSARVNAISTNGRDYEFAREFPGYDLLLWSVKPEKVLPDRNVKVVLVRVPTQFDR